MSLAIAAINQRNSNTGVNNDFFQHLLTIALQIKRSLPALFLPLHGPQDSTMKKAIAINLPSLRLPESQLDKTLASTRRKDTTSVPGSYKT